MTLLQAFATQLTGFSIFGALLLLATQFRCSEYQDNLIPRIAGLALLASLTWIQIVHFGYLQNISDLTQSQLYSISLFTVAPAFYFFSKHLLKANTQYKKWHYLHLLPIILALFIPSSIALPLSFIIGSGYVIWLAHTVYQLRNQRDRFKLEILALSIMFIIAVTVLILGLSMPLIDNKTFYSLYAINIGLAYLITALILLVTPELTTEVAEAAHAAYAESTLENIDTHSLLKKLEKLMLEDKVYTDEELNLGMLAEQVGLTSHQLSELINKHLKKGFSQYIREYRIDEAKRLLVEEPQASVLSIGLEVGFTSQSNFYAAFKKVLGSAPGQYRKLQLKQA